MLVFAYALNFGILFFYVVVSHAFRGFTESSCWWDCGWYLGIAKAGYAHLPIKSLPPGSQANWAFFPLFPEAVRLLHSTTGLGLNISALTLNNAVFPIMLASTGWYSLKFRSINPYVVIILISASPFSLYFRVEYSETLYGALLVVILILLSMDAIWAAAICGAFFTASRPTAAPILALMGAWLLARAYAGAGIWATIRTIPRVASFGAIGAVGLLAYMLYLRHITGDALAFVHIQSSWQRDLGNPFLNILRGIETPGMTAASFVSQSASQRYLGLSCAIVLALVIYGVWARLWIESLILLLTTLLTASSGLMSAPRYFFANPITFIIIGRLLAPIVPEYRALIYSLMFMFQAIVVVLWYQRVYFLM